VCSIYNVVRSRTTTLQIQRHWLQSEEPKCSPILCNMGHFHYSPHRDDANETRLFLVCLLLHHYLVYRATVNFACACPCCAAFSNHVRACACVSFCLRWLSYNSHMAPACPAVAAFSYHSKRTAFFLE